MFYRLIFLNYEFFEMAKDLIHLVDLKWMILLKNFQFKIFFLFLFFFFLHKIGLVSGRVEVEVCRCEIVLCQEIWLAGIRLKYLSIDCAVAYKVKVFDYGGNGTTNSRFSRDIWKLFSAHLRFLKLNYFNWNGQIYAWAHPGDEFWVQWFVFHYNQ